MTFEHVRQLLSDLFLQSVLSLITVNLAFAALRATLSLAEIVGIRIAEPSLNQSLIKKRKQTLTFADLFKDLVNNEDR
jgi:hypothetical protein